MSEQQTTKVKNLDPYKGDKDEKNFAVSVVEKINKDLETREGFTKVFNGMSYTAAYEYNQEKALNYSPARQKDEARQVSYGIVHEKIIGFCSFFLKNVYKRRIKCYDEYGNIVEGMGEIYDLAIEHSYKREKLHKKIGLIYWEIFTQGSCPIFEEWEVRNIIERVAKDKDGKVVDLDDVDYSMEYFDNLKWEKGEMVQERRAVSKLMDGRCVIYGDPTINEVQDQPRITLEDVISPAYAEELYGSMKRWKGVPKTREQMLSEHSDEKMKLFDTERIHDYDNQMLRHFYFDKENNRFNLFLNGTMMLPRDTAFRYFYPRNNYPLSLPAAERLYGSIYPRSIPAKTKFNADFLDWALTMLAEKFEQGVDPALLVKGKYTLTKDLFRGGQRTHGVSKDDYEKADPDNKGLTNSEFGFVGLLKDILEQQTLNSTTSGEVSGSTATAVNQAQANQIEKLGYLLDGVIGGMIEMAERRAETIENKYTLQDGETYVDGEKVPVYQNFTVAMGGTENSVVFDDKVGEPDFDEDAKRDELFKKSFDDNKRGMDTAYHLVNPKLVRKRKFTVDIEIVPERKKDTYLKLIELREETDFLLNTWGQEVDKEVWKKEYLDITGRPDSLFLPAELIEKQQPQETPDDPAARGRAGAVQEAVKTNAE